MLLTTKSGQPISMVITKTPRAIPTGKPFVRPDDPQLGFYVKNNGTEPVTLKVIGVDDTVASETVFMPGWNLELIKAIVANVPATATIQWGV